MRRRRRRRATRSTASSPGAMRDWPTVSSIASSSRRRRTTGTRTASRRCSKCSTRSALPAACPCTPRDLDRIMVRRLKADLRQSRSRQLPGTSVEAIALDTPGAEPELALAQMLRDYGKLRSKRISRLSAGKAASAKLSFIGPTAAAAVVGAAFAKTLASSSRVPDQSDRGGRGAPRPRSRPDQC